MATILRSRWVCRGVCFAGRWVGAETKEDAGGGEARSGAEEEKW